jgi:hypothetical protein
LNQAHRSSASTPLRSIQTNNLPAVRFLDILC